MQNTELVVMAALCSHLPAPPYLLSQTAKRGNAGTGVVTRVQVPRSKFLHSNPMFIIFEGGLLCAENRRSAAVD